MNVLFLRGKVPTDRNPNEIKFNSLEEEDDVWTHLAMAMGDVVEVVYWGGKRRKRYSPQKSVVWTPSLKKYRPPFEPEIIFARGGFPEYHSVLKRYPAAFKIYYGAGRRHLPIKGFSDYQLTLQDSPRQLSRAKRKFPNIKHVLWTKPAPPQFYPRDVGEPKEYDVCYIANGGQAKIKRIPWVYKTVPEDLKVLHLGLPSGLKPPKNVTCKRVLKNDMPEWISKCWVGIIPYSRVDSAPRALPEMLACGLKVVVCDGVNYNDPGDYSVYCSPLSRVWEEVRFAMKYARVCTVDLSVEAAASRILFHRTTGMIENMKIV